MKKMPPASAFKLDAVSQSQLDAWLFGASTEKPATSNQPALALPFQRWFKFKEAFAPCFVVDSIQRLPYTPKSCLDPFAGSGTTALTCQFLGITPTTIEVNPFIADIVEAKLGHYNIAELKHSLRVVLRIARRMFSEKIPQPYFPQAPMTFVEPGLNGRWIYGKNIAKAIAAIRTAIEKIDDASAARLMRVILGGRLIELSNVIVNGKGRRYRRNWEERTVQPEQVFTSFELACISAIMDIESFDRRRCKEYTIFRGDARTSITKSKSVDFILTSPPYPNSFDYTDIYNVELWALGYLSNGSDNTALRNSTLRSHVQIRHKGSVAIELTPTLKKTYLALCKHRADFWNRNIPEMVCHYFADMQSVLEGCHSILRRGGHMMLALGDSRYAGVLVDVPKILTEIAEDIGFKLLKNEAVRSMRTSAQQGGGHMLNESLLWLSS